MPSFLPGLSQWLQHQGLPYGVLVFLGFVWYELKASEARQEKRIDELRADMKEGFAQVRADQRAEIKEVRSEMRDRQGATYRPEVPVTVSINGPLMGEIRAVPEVASPSGGADAERPAAPADETINITGGGVGVTDGPAPAEKVGIKDVQGRASDVPPPTLSGTFTVSTGGHGQQEPPSPTPETEERPTTGAVTMDVTLPLQPCPPAQSVTMGHGDVGAPEPHLPTLQLIEEEHVLEDALRKRLAGVAVAPNPPVERDIELWSACRRNWKDSAYLDVQGSRLPGPHEDGSKALARYIQIHKKAIAKWPESRECALLQSHGRPGGLLAHAFLQVDAQLLAHRTGLPLTTVEAELKREGLEQRPMDGIKYLARNIHMRERLDGPLLAQVTGLPLATVEAELRRAGLEPDPSGSTYWPWPGRALDKLLQAMRAAKHRSGETRGGFRTLCRDWLRQHWTDDLPQDEQAFARDLDFPLGEALLTAFREEWQRMALVERQPPTP